MKMLRFLIVLLGLVASVSCREGRHSRLVAATLDDVETYIDERPDSALAVLRSLDADSLRGPAQRARAALLHQMALDKCYIDIVSDSVLAPAFWYLRHGDADQKLKTWYYRSVLSRNAGDIDAQMSCLVRAEQYVPHADAPLIAGRLYTAERVIYLNLYDLDNAIIAATRATEYFRQAEDRKRWLDALISQANLFNMTNQEEALEKTQQEIQDSWSELTDKQRGIAGAVALDFASRKAQSGEMLRLIEDYMAKVPSRWINWISVANAYLQAGNTLLAEQALERLSLSVEEQGQDVSYLLVKSRLLEAKGDAKGAFEVYQRYNQLSDEKLQRNISTEVRFLPEREGNKHKIAGLSRRVWVLLSLFVMGIVIALMGVRVYRRQIARGRTETANIRREYAKVTRELSRLEDMTKRGNWPIEDVPLLTKRLNMLNQYSAYYLQGRRDECQRLSRNLFGSPEDSRLLFRSLCPTFFLGQPKFHSYLREKGLNLREQNICCLVYLGFTRKEIAYYLDLTPQYCYNLTASARKKLGIRDTGTDFRGFLGQLIAERESNI